MPTRDERVPRKRVSHKDNPVRASGRGRTPERERVPSRKRTPERERVRREPVRRRERASVREAARKRERAVRREPVRRPRRKASVRRRRPVFGGFLSFLSRAAIALIILLAVGKVGNGLVFQELQVNHPDNSAAAESVAPPPSAPTNHT